MRRPGRMRELCAFDPPLEIADAAGGTTAGWDEINNVIRWAEVIYQRGEESVQAGKLTGSAVYKIRIRNSGEARRITPDWRARLPVRGMVLQIREVDSVSDRSWIWIRAETGVAL